jgi:hypothetical protein
MARVLALCVALVTALGSSAVDSVAASAEAGSGRDPALAGALPPVGAGGRPGSERPLDWRPRLRVSTGISDESNDFERYTASILADFEPLSGTALRLPPLFSHFEQDGETINRFSLGLELRQALPAELRGWLRYRLHVPDGVTPTHEFVAELGRRFWDALELRAGLRRRALVDVPPPYEDVAYLEGVGSGGSTLAGIEERLQILEGYVGGSLAPVGGIYVYSEIAPGSINDGNDAFTAVWGLGVDVLHYVDAIREHSFSIKYDGYHLDMAESEPEYFSPDGFTVHTPSLEWRWRPYREAVVGAGSGISLRGGATPGWNFTVFGRLPLRGPFQLEGRVFRSDDTEFRITSGTLALIVNLR